MTAPVKNIFVRRADFNSVIELVVARVDGTSEVHPMNLGWMRGLVVDGARMLLGSAISQETSKPNGRQLDGKSTIHLGNPTDSIQSSVNGRGVVRGIT